MYRVVSEVQVARDELTARDTDVTEAFRPSAPGGHFEPGPERCSHRRHGCPPRELRSFAIDLANAMRRASIAHGEHESRIGEADANRPDWYAAIHGRRALGNSADGESTGERVP
jgi:hypothetical protein